MGHEVAYDFINQEISSLRTQSYADLVARIGKTEHKEFLAHDGNRYLLEIEIFWDSKKGGDIRVMVCADGGGVSAVFPVSDAFIMAPDGTIVG
jgi:hypothetical protein